MTCMRKIFILLTLALLAACMGCGWSSPESKRNSMTGVSESGYPKGSPADAGSPALASMEKPGAKEAKEKAKK
jgi:hypothetical protein